MSITISFRLVRDDDTDFVLSLLPRLVAFPLPDWRTRRDCLAGIGAELRAHLDEPPEHAELFVAEDAVGTRVGFVELQRTRDYFNGRANAHVNQLAVAPEHEGEGIGRAMLEHARAWARARGCALLTLAVFPGNARARALYEACGYGIDLLRMARPVD